MRPPGPPQSAFGLLGGPGFLVVCMLIVGIAGGIAYLALTRNLASVGQAAIQLPGATVPQAPGPLPTDAQPPSGAAELKSMPAVPVAKEISVSVAIEEDLSPSELLAKYPPDPNTELPAGSEGQPTWQRFGRTSTVSAEAPRVALVITGLGGDRIDTVRAITGAPAEASLSFRADATDLADWIAAARAYGHEALLDLPLQSAEAAGNDNLTPQLGPDENLRRLDAMLAGAPMIAGVAISGGDSFLADAAVLQPLLRHLEARHLAVVGVPITAPLTIAADEAIGGAAQQSEIDAALRSLMALALRRGAALGIVDAAGAAALFPAWNRALIGHDEISLVPVTALVEE